MEFSDRIGRRMKLHDIHVLIAVVQAGMGKAAALLNTTQSAISRSIADLENTMGVRLLDRSHQGVEATNYGRALLKRSIAVFDELKQSVLSSGSSRGTPVRSCSSMKSLLLRLRGTFLNCVIGNTT